MEKPITAHNLKIYEHKKAINIIQKCGMPKNGSIYLMVISHLRQQGIN